MASVFAYEPDPPRIASPWSATSPGLSHPHANDTSDDAERDNAQASVQDLGGLLVPGLARLEDYGLTALEPEPEFGPVEYKLHLLLRQRQVWLPASSVGGGGSGVGGAGDEGDQLRAEPARIRGARPMTYRNPASEPATLQDVAAHRSNAAIPVHADGPPTSYSATSLQSRQQRLLHLTTQLLWRLKQSSPYHAFSTVDSIIPKLPDASAARLNAPTRPEKLLPGLEESQGAMYEIGVADDGCFVGLTRDEMDESLINLRAMAASLGCNVSIVRAISITSDHADSVPHLFTTVSTDSTAGNKVSGAASGRAPTLSAHEENHQQQQQQQQQQEQLSKRRQPENLYVVEALVLPDTGAGRPFGQSHRVALDNELAKYLQGRRLVSNKSIPDAEQLRVSLTGSTTSGKSTLVGTLSASTLDDARGKSRLNLLKHRHEIASGVTSSVAHELLGYHASSDSVVNYAYQNVDSWTDVHDTAEGGRLVLLTDSAGHPRFRRTIIRSLVAWQPHWTLCCIATVYSGDSYVSETNDTYGASMDESGLDIAQALAIAHLELCLRLELPLVVVITKYDLATRAGLKQTLGRILTILKAANRTPQLLRPSPPTKSEEELQIIPAPDIDEVRGIVEEMQDEGKSIVPIVLTSAVSGVGIGKLHALLRHLPVPRLQGPNDDEERSERTREASRRSNGTHRRFASTLFDIDEIFVKDVQPYMGGGSSSMPKHDDFESKTYVLSGLLRRGMISIGDSLLLGPFSTEATWRGRDQRPPLDMRRTASYPVTHHEMAMRRQAKIGPRRRRSSEDVSAELQPDRLAFTVEAEASDSPTGPEEQVELGQACEWLLVQVTSVRNLRLPVHSSFGGHCVTVGVSLPGRPDMATVRPRKGMVLVGLDKSDEGGEAEDSLEEHDMNGNQHGIASCSAFQAVFPMEDYHAMEPGAQFNAYIGSVRALAKVVTVGLYDDEEDHSDRSNTSATRRSDVETKPAVPSLGSGLNREFAKLRLSRQDRERELQRQQQQQQHHQIFPLDESADLAATAHVRLNNKLEIMFRLVNSREYIEVGAKVFVMPGHAGEGSAALSGFVGRVTEVLA